MTDELKAWSEERAYERAKAEYVEKLDRIKAELIEEKDFAYADFNQYKVDYLGVKLKKNHLSQ